MHTRTHSHTLTYTRTHTRRRRGPSRVLIPPSNVTPQGTSCECVFMSLSLSLSLSLPPSLVCVCVCVCVCARARALSLLLKQHTALVTLRTRIGYIPSMYIHVRISHSITWMYVYLSITCAVTAQYMHRLNRRWATRHRQSSACPKSSVVAGKRKRRSHTGRCSSVRGMRE